jgi:hypothetical protein
MIKLLHPNILKPSFYTGPRQADQPHGFFVLTKKTVTRFVMIQLQT